MSDCQRWGDGEDSYRPAGEPIDTRRYEVAEIDSDSVAKRFVERHHYSGSYPAARFRYGIYTIGSDDDQGPVAERSAVVAEGLRDGRRGDGEGRTAPDAGVLVPAEPEQDRADRLRSGEPDQARHGRDDPRLFGVAVFSHPVSDLSITNVFPGPVTAGVELGRFVLLDRVPANGETWFLARCFELLRRDGIEGVISCSDPMPRPRADGSVVMAGHCGVIYQAHNGVLIGRTDPRIRVILPDGREFNPRLKAKVRAAARGDEAKARGWRAAVDTFSRYGDPGPALFDGDVDGWLDHCIRTYGGRYRHLGNHKYAWGLTRSARRKLPKSEPFPKRPDPLIPAGPARSAA